MANPHEVLARCHEHCEAEAAFDVDRVLATLVPEPAYAFFPQAQGMSGRPLVERFYREQYPRFAAQVSDYTLLGEWCNHDSALQEYRIGIRGRTGPPSSYRVMSVMPVDEDSGLIQGERLYADEAFVQALLGPLAAHLVPLSP